MNTAAAVFDGLAADYDARFTGSTIGCLLRSAVWRRLEAHFPSGTHVLELGCGTGEDAVHLAEVGVRVLATDAAPAMLDAASRKARSHGVADRVAFASLALESLGAGSAGRAPPEVERAAPFDGAFSNFGALNCVLDLTPIAAALAALLPAGAPVVLTIMGPLCAWEWAWFLARARPATALRRLRP
ncbi:MAG: SAM-dependent methyltransferase, partial [Longimicrobiales bacterium]